MGCAIALPPEPMSESNESTVARCFEGIMSLM